MEIGSRGGCFPAGFSCILGLFDWVRMVTMKYRTMMATTGVLILFWSVLFFVFTISSENESVPAAGDNFVIAARWGGVVLVVLYVTGVGIGSFAWRKRKLEHPEYQRKLAYDFLGYGLVLLICPYILMLLPGYFDPWATVGLWSLTGTLMWSFIAITLLVVCGFGYLLFFGELKKSKVTASVRNPKTLRQAWERQLEEAAVREERSRLARELHDSIKQQIFTINVTAATAQARWDSDPDEARQAVEHVRGAVREAMIEMEAMLQNLSPAPLEKIGLIEALRKQCEALQYRAGVKVTAEFGDLPNDELLPPGAQEAIFRIAQEGLNNIARHARAENVWLHLSYKQKDEKPLISYKQKGEKPLILFELRDDGKGFDPAQSSPGMGLSNIRHRADELGGTTQIESVSGQGTTLTVRLPLWRKELSNMENLIKSNLRFFNLLGKPWYYVGVPVFVIVLALIAGGAAIYASRVPDIYRSVARVQVDITLSPEEFTHTDGHSVVDDRINAIREQLASRSFLERMIETLRLYGYGTNPDFTMERAVIGAQRQLAIQKTSDRTFTVSFIAIDPQVAQSVTRQMTQELVHVGNQAEDAAGNDGGDGDARTAGALGKTNVLYTIIDEANLPIRPESPDRAQIIWMGIAGGIVFGITASMIATFIFVGLRRILAEAPSRMKIILLSIAVGSTFAIFASIVVLFIFVLLRRFA
jgi:signal transduction histidine kinase